MSRVRRFIGIVLSALALIVVSFAALAFWALQHTSPLKPDLPGRMESGELQHDGRARSWIAYIPPQPARNPALMIVLHGSMGSGAQARADAFGYDFDVLADRHGFIAIYPQGYGGEWNDAKVQGPFPAKRENVDDVGFLHALVQRFVTDHDVDPARVYVAGVSNGGSMVLRLALQTPEFARAYAVVASSMPTPANMAITPIDRAVSILFMNGSEDPINPWDGGDVVLWPVLRSRGPVRSVRASVDYFRALAQLEGEPEVTGLPDRDPSDGSTVERSAWSGLGKRSVAQFVIVGGGHIAPLPARHGMRLLGRSNRDIHAADEIWAFFESAP
jgi:polyhydroxybutyrate depolymerase